ncbi:hypothetical protein ADL03_14660 [Nocardia sp. NRRL S-836]|nr:hypothetical protein ADL03_14660 [Nocardia sp. NRRL S-836]
MTIRGDLDAHTAPEVLRAINALTPAAGQLLVVDLGELRFCDSSGISAFIAARNLVVAAQAEIALAGVPRQIQRVLRMIGLDGLFTFRPSAEDAVAAHRADQDGGR